MPGSRYSLEISKARKVVGEKDQNGTTASKTITRTSNESNKEYRIFTPLSESNSNYCI